MYGFLEGFVKRTRTMYGLHMSNLPNLQPESCRAARALLGWGVRDLAAKAEVSVDTIVQFEKGRPMRQANKDRLGALFAEAGVEILNGDAPGARLRRLA